MSAPYVDTARLDVRLDAEHRRKLDDVAAARGASVSKVVRELIDDAYEAVRRDTRRRAANQLNALEVDDVPEPPELSQVLDQSHAITPLR